MKVAVCVSGLCGDDALLNVRRLQDRFPFDFYYGVWKGRENETSEQLKAIVLDEPELNYHPYLDINDCSIPKFLQIKKGILTGKLPELKEQSKHHTKQILAHAHMLNHIQHEYDIIIRTRYDVIISDDVNFEEYIAYAYNNNCAVGFGLPFKRRPLNFISEVDRGERLWLGYLMDILIIHPLSLFDTNLVFKMHDQKQLRAAEWGWYQILSQTHGDNHRCIFGGVQVNRA